MAIGKTKVLSSGVSGNYWKIICEYYDRNSGRIEFFIALFKDKAASDAGKNHLGIVKKFCTSITREEASSNRTAFGYNFIRTKSASMVTPISGGSQVVYDTDLANGEMV